MPTFLPSSAPGSKDPTPLPGPGVEGAGAVEIPTGIPTTPWKTLRVSPHLPHPLRRAETGATNRERSPPSVSTEASTTLTEGAIEATIPEDTALRTAVVNQGTIFYDADGMTSNEASRLTDDPAEPGAEDPTVFLVGAASVLEIPTLGQTALLLLALLLAAAGALALRP